LFQERLKPEYPAAMYLQSNPLGFLDDPFQNLLSNKRLLVHRLIPRFLFRGNTGSPKPLAAKGKKNWIF
jgi:hypothetical protein